MKSNYRIDSDSALDGYQAIDKVKERLDRNHQLYKIIFMDCNMPIINGLETTKKIK